jgi:hypothetical protein
MQTEVQAGTLRPVIFYEGEFASGTLRLWSGLGSISWNGQSWQGAGNLLSISAVTETADVRAAPMTVMLSGNVSALIATALAEARLGKPGKVWLGATNEAGAIIVDPYLAFSGRLNVPKIEDAGEQCAISITYESRLIDLQRARARRWSDEDQQIDFPGDLGFEYVSGLPEQVIEW